MGENTSKTCDWQWVNLKKKKNTISSCSSILKKKKKIVSNTNYKRSAKQPSSHQKPLFCFPEDGAVKQGLISLNWTESSHYTLSLSAASKLLFHGLLISPVRRAARPQHLRLPWVPRSALSSLPCSLWWQVGISRLWLPGISPSGVLATHFPQVGGSPRCLGVTMQRHSCWVMDVWLIVNQKKRKREGLVPPLCWRHSH